MERLVKQKVLSSIWIGGCIKIFLPAEEVVDHEGALRHPPNIRKRQPSLVAPIPLGEDVLELLRDKPPLCVKDLLVRSMLAFVNIPGEDPQEWVWDPTRGAREGKGRVDHKHCPDGEEHVEAQASESCKEKTLFGFHEEKNV